MYSILDVNADVNAWARAAMLPPLSWLIGSASWAAFRPGASLSDNPAVLAVHLMTVISCIIRRATVVRRTFRRIREIRY